MTTRSLPRFDTFGAQRIPTGKLYRVWDKSYRFSATTPAAANGRSGGRATVAAINRFSECYRELSKQVWNACTVLCSNNRFLRFPRDGHVGPTTMACSVYIHTYHGHDTIEIAREKEICIELSGTAPSSELACPCTLPFRRSFLPPRPRPPFFQRARFSESSLVAFVYIRSERCGAKRFSVAGSSAARCTRRDASERASKPNQPGRKNKRTRKASSFVYGRLTDRDRGIYYARYVKPRLLHNNGFL